MFRPETKDIQTNRETEEGMKSRLCQSMGVNLGKTHIKKCLFNGRTTKKTFFLSLALL